MYHRFSKILLDGEKHQVEIVQTSKEESELEPGDLVEYHLLGGGIWQSARVVSIHRIDGGKLNVISLERIYPSWSLPPVGR